MCQCCLQFTPAHKVLVSQLDKGKELITSNTATMKEQNQLKPEQMAADRPRDSRGKISELTIHGTGPKPMEKKNM